MHHLRREFTISSTGAYAVVPADLATIYNLNPLFDEGISGQGQTVVVIEDTNVYDVDCVTGSPDCSASSGDSIGILSDPNSGVSAYGTATGWDFASGIGSINAYNLVNAWPVSTTPDFSLSASPSSVTILQGSNGQGTVTVNATNGFSGDVTLINSALPSGVGLSYNPNPASASSALTFTASPTAATGTTNVTITGTSGSLSHQVTVSLTVKASATPNFTLSASLNSLTISKGGSGTSTITVNPQNGFTGSVSLNASGLPRNVTASFSPSSTTTTSTLTLTASGRAGAGTKIVTITGKSGKLSHTTTISVTIP